MIVSVQRDTAVVERGSVSDSEERGCSGQGEEGCISTAVGRVGLVIWFCEGGFGDEWV